MQYKIIRLTASLMLCAYCVSNSLLLGKWVLLSPLG